MNWRNILLLVAVTLLKPLAGSGRCMGDTARSNIYAPDLLLKGVTGNVIHTKKLRGKVVLINFWAMSCIPCKEEMPWIDKLKRTFAADTGFVVLSVDLGNDPKTALAYFTKNGYCLDEHTVAGVLPEVYFKGVLPTTLVLDKNGAVVFYKEEQYRYDGEEFIEMIRLLLAGAQVTGR